MSGLLVQKTPGSRFGLHYDVRGPAPRTPVVCGNRSILYETGLFVTG